MTHALRPVVFAWLASVLAVSSAVAQPLPVDVLYCNVVCAGPSPTDSCSIGLVGGLSIEAARGDVIPREAGDGVEMLGELAIPTGDGGGIPLAQAALELRFSEPAPDSQLGRGRAHEAQVKVVFIGTRIPNVRMPTATPQSGT